MRDDDFEWHRQQAELILRRDDSQTEIPMSVGRWDGPTHYRDVRESAGGLMAEGVVG